ncbi:MAG: hypothetical protein QG635_2360, partial [Bacteroidota bacterium]|nr:hypothetical protein [Bacteroidota bacterium]
MKKIAVILWAALITLPLQAQFVEDALRYALPNGYFTPRSGGFNVAFYGISDDIAALNYNPAGMSIGGKSELSFGLGFLRSSSETNFMYNKTSFNSNDSYISHAGMMIPFPTKLGNAAVGIGYFLESNFDNNYKYQGFNGVPTSMIQYFASQKPTSGNAEDNIAYHQWLSDAQGNTKIIGNLTDNAFVEESGGLHNVSAGLAFDLTKNVSAGFSLTGKWGTYGYKRDYTEQDVSDLYNESTTMTIDGDAYPLDLNKFKIEERLSQKISGITGAVGVMGRLGDMLRFGCSIKFPTFYEVNETFNINAYTTFDAP